MDFRILGPLEVRDARGRVPLPRGRARSLLALLVLHAGEVLSKERLLDQLWGAEPPPTASTALHGRVSALRRALERDEPRALRTHPPGYALGIQPEDVDANRFRRVIADAARVRSPGARSHVLRSALALWRGPALADFTYEPFAQPHIAGLEELRLQALEQRIDADMALGRHRDILDELERLATEHPLREGLVGRLMLARYRSGRQAEALTLYAATRDALRAELAVDPGRPLQQLERGIRRQDPSLEPAAPGR